MNYQSPLENVDMECLPLHSVSMLSMLWYLDYRQTSLMCCHWSPPLSSIMDPLTQSSLPYLCSDSKHIHLMPSQCKHIQALMFSVSNAFLHSLLIWLLYSMVLISTYSNVSSFPISSFHCLTQMIQSSFYWTIQQSFHSLSLIESIIFSIESSESEYS